MASEVMESTTVVRMTRVTLSSVCVHCYIGSAGCLYTRVQFTNKCGMEYWLIFNKIPKIAQQSECPRHCQEISKIFSTKEMWTGADRSMTMWLGSREVGRDFRERFRRTIAS